MIPRCGVPDTSVLPDQPDVFGAVIETAYGDYLQRWAPGAFGEGVETIAGVLCFQVEKDEWDGTGDGPPRRTIKKARIMDAGLRPV